MVNIDSIQARTARVPLYRPTSMSLRKVTERYFTLVRVRCDDGTEGIGFCCGGTVAGELTTQAVRDLLAPRIRGDDPYRVEGIWHDLYQEALLHGRAGIAMRALSAVDIALWDRNARALQLPLRNLLGSFTKRDRVPAYASGGYYIEGETPDSLGEEMRSLVADGFRAVKMKVGRLRPHEDIDRVRSAREAIGPDVSLMLDANNAWSSLPDALEHLHPLLRFDPYWIEEPFSPDDIDNHVRLANRIPIAIASGEIEAGRWRHRDLITRGAVQILQPDAAVCGGVTEFRRIAGLADTFGVSIAPHWLHDLHVHLVAATRNAVFVEYLDSGHERTFSSLIDTQIEVSEGELILPMEPGLGFQFSEDAMAQFCTDEWQ